MQNGLQERLAPPVGDTEHARLAVGDSVVISKKHGDTNIRGAAAVITKVHSSGSYTVHLKLDGSSRLTRHVEKPPGGVHFEASPAATAAPATPAAAYLF